MDTGLAQRAVELALAHSWDEAIKINLQILKAEKSDLDALNRLSRAYAETGQMDKASLAAKKALKVDPVNSIAQKALIKWQALKKTGKPVNTSTSSETFLEEPGKTKLIELIHPGDAEILAGLNSGEMVNLIPHPHRISVVTPDGKYLGRLPDDLAARLRRLIKDGGKYQTLVKSIDGRNIKVFIRGDVISFPPEKIDYVSFTPPELVHKETPEIPMTEEG